MTASKATKSERVASGRPFLFVSLVECVCEAAVELTQTTSLRGRLGHNGGAFMPYLTAGLAFDQGHALPPDVINMHVGWTIGAGVEFAVSDALSVDLLYRYTDLARQNYAGPGLGFETHSVTAGLNWSF